MLELIALILFPMLLLSSVATPFAQRVNLMDYPCERKQHGAPTPLVGGVLVFLMVLWVLFTSSSLNMAVVPLISVGSLYMAMGLYDDLYGAKALPRLAFQVFLAAAFLAYTGAGLASNVALTPDSLWVIATTGGGFVLSLIFVVGVVNAFNFMDGMDGLAAVLIIAALLGLTIFQTVFEFHNLEIFIQSLIVITFVFWLKNTGVIRNRKMFLGDSGSTMLGFFVAALLLSNIKTGPYQSSFNAVDVFWCIFIPMIDTFTVIVRRISQRKSPFKPDRTHMHHLFLDAGFGVRTTCFVVLLMALSFAVLGVFVKLYIPWLSLYVVVGSALIYFFLFYNTQRCTSALAAIRRLFA